MMQASAEIMPLATHQNILNSNFLNTAYGISSLGQRHPPYTTSEFALFPFKPSINTEEIQSSTQTWSTKTDVYSTSLDCEPAIRYSSNETGFSHQIFDNGRGCTISDFSFSLNSADVLLLYLGWFGDAVVDRSIGGPNCTREHADNFLAIWATKGTKFNSVDDDSMTALFCRPKYHVQEAVVTVNASDGRVASHKLIGTREQLPVPNEIFNTTHFEYLVSTGVPPVRQRANRPDTFRLEPYPSVAKYNLSWPMPNAVGFGVSLNEGTVQDLKDPKVLHRAFEKAHQLLFAVAFNIVTRPLNSTTIDRPRDGTIKDNLGAITVDTTIARIVQGAFGLVIVMTLSLWCLTFRRPSHLRSDPATISNMMSLVRDIDLGDDISGHIFKLTTYGTENRGRICLLANSRKEITFPISITKSKSLHIEDINQARPVIRPFELRVGFGVLFITVISSALIAVIFLQLYSSRRNGKLDLAFFLTKTITNISPGIALPSVNSTVISIIENYLPTIFATLLEPAWVILNRILCLLQPFDELRKGNAKPSVSVHAKYTSLPPQLNVWRALRSGHFILALVCMIAVSTNLLAVALSVLIEQRSTTVTFPMAGTQSLVPIFDGGPLVRDVSLAVYLDHFYAAQSNLTTGTSLPPWIDPERFYIPFEFESPRIETAAGTPLGLQGIMGSTTGIGAELSCYELYPDQNAEHSFSFTSTNISTHVHFKTSDLLSNGTRVNCEMPDLYTINQEGPNNVFLGNLTSAASAVELIGHRPENGSSCSNAIMAGWVHVSANNSIPSIASTSFGARNLTHTFLTCTPQLKVATFDVLVSPEGRILRSHRTSNFTPITEIAQYFTNVTYQTPVTIPDGIQSPPAPKASANGLFDDIAANTMGLPDSEAMRWHNDSFTSDWMNSLIMYRMGNDSVVNPASPVLTFQQGEALLKEVYKLLFALMIGLNQHAFENSPSKITKEITVLATEQRIFLEPTMFKMTVILLSFQLIVAILYYVYRPKRFLTSMPTSIASIIAFVSHSRALEDFRDGGKSADDGERRYGYGRFVGTDGKTHVGIERSRWVVPLESENPEVGRGKWWEGLRFRGKRREGEVKVWI